MTDIENTNDDYIGLEKMNYTRFYIAHAVRRPTQAPSKVDQLSLMQLPTNSVLHSLNGFDTLISPNEGLPDTKIPMVRNEKLPVYLKINTKLPDENSKPFGVSESYIYRPNTLMPSVMHFFQKHREYRRILSDRTLATMRGVLTWVDYSPMNELKVFGTLKEYRKFDILFRSILDTVSTIGNEKYHYILLPQSTTVYSRALLQRTFKTLSTGTLNMFLKDPSIFPILHILGYVYGKTHEIDVTPYKEDVRLLGKSADILENAKSTSLLERLDPSLLSAINFIIYRDDKAVIYNLADLSTFAEDVSFYNKFYRHIMNIRIVDAVLPSHVEADSDQFDTLIDTLSGTTAVEEPKTTITKVEPVKPVTEPKDIAPVPDSPEPVISSVKELKTEIKASLPQTPLTIKPVVKDIVDEIPIHVETKSIPFEDKIRSEVRVKSVDKVEEVKVTQKRNTLLDNHFKAVLADKPISTLIHKETSDVVKPKKMDFITAAPEKSYKSSSLISMDRSYHKNTSKHDLAKVISSTAKHGLYINKIEEEKTNTEMDRTITYKINLADDTGKSHTVRFTLPDVDDNGLMKISGVEYRLTRQIANLPICKISPTRVNLSSYYNKVIIERIQSKRNSYEQDMYKLIHSLKAIGKLEISSGSSTYATSKTPFDYSAIGRYFRDIKVNGYNFIFGKDATTEVEESTKDAILKMEEDYGIYVGTGPDATYIFWDKSNKIHLVDRSGIPVRSWLSFTHFLIDEIGDDAIPTKQTLEWTQANIINQTIPLIFILGYKFGLKNTLDMINLDYRFYQIGTKPVIETMDISIKFSDGYLVFNRYPVSRSLLASGLGWVSLKDISFKELSVPETYGKVFRKKDMTVGVLKGLNGFFDFFVDPITESVLEKMHEPTSFHGLLLRANIMLTDYHADEASSIKLHRFRHQERFNGIVYNEIYRELANYRNNPSTKKSFSLNPEAVFSRIMQDATISPNDSTNPVHEVKQRANFTFTGSGGRTANSLVLRDRMYPKDGLGVVSDAVPDSGKVGITAYLSTSPRIDDVHGIPKPYTEGDELEPPEILSIGSMVMPGGTTDDGKRNSYLSIQISHYVPNIEDGETLAVRTGYDEVLPHLSGDTFATTADDNGTIVDIDTKHKVLKVKYTDKDIIPINTIKVPYVDTVVNRYKESKQSFGILIPDIDVGKYPINGVFSITKSTYVKVVDKLRCDTIEAIPDKEVARKQNSLVQDFIKGKYKSLYFMRLMPIGTKTPGTTKSYSFASVYSPISGAYLLQERKPNFSVGDSFKNGDILIYNPGFFVPDPMSKQVTFKHGVIATVALIEKSTNHEDACEISRDFSQRLKMTPCHQREVITTAQAAVLNIAKIGDHVETSDNLCIISDDYLIGTDLNTTMENLDIMEKLSRQTPKAGYSGYIRKIRMLYGGDKADLSDSLKAILRTYEKEVKDNFKALNSDSSILPPDKPGWVKPGTKYHGIIFTKDTVILEFMIEETIDVGEGDKLCFGNANKSIVSYVSEKPHYTESGIPIDALFSTTSIVNRIVASPFNGIAERNMDKLKENVIDMYFNKK